MMLLKQWQLIKNSSPFISRKFQLSLASLVFKDCKRNILPFYLNWPNWLGSNKPCETSSRVWQFVPSIYFYYFLSLFDDTRKYSQTISWLWNTVSVWNITCSSTTQSRPSVSAGYWSLWLSRRRISTDHWSDVESQSMIWKLKYASTRLSRSLWALSLYPGMYECMAQWASDWESGRVGEGEVEQSDAGSCAHGELGCGSSGTGGVGRSLAGWRHEGQLERVCIQFAESVNKMGDVEHGRRVYARERAVTCQTPEDFVMAEKNDTRNTQW